MRMGDYRREFKAKTTSALVDVKLLLERCDFASTRSEQLTSAKQVALLGGFEKS